MERKKIVILLIVVFSLSFSLGFLLNQPQKFDSCKAIYDNLFEEEICYGKLDAFSGTSAVMGHTEDFDFNWGDGLGNMGIIKDVVSGIENQCYSQAHKQFIDTGERENLINCFANIIEIEEGILDIQCRCYFG
jgi:hypothetical protein